MATSQQSRYCGVVSIPLGQIFVSGRRRLLPHEDVVDVRGWCAEDVLELVRELGELVLALLKLLIFPQQYIASLFSNFPSTVLSSDSPLTATVYCGFIFEFASHCV